MSRRSVLIEALAATPRDLARTLRRVDDAQAERRVVSDGSSIRDIITHLCEAEVVYLARWQSAVTRVDGDQSSENPPVSEPNVQRSFADLVAQFADRRAVTLAFLSGLEQQDWGIVLDGEGISVRLREDVQALVTHDNEHLSQILELREASDALR